MPLSRRALLSAGAAGVASIGVGEPAAPARIWPHVLESGATVALIAPASPVEQKDVDDVVARLAALGLKSKAMPHLLNKSGLFAGTDADRAADFNRSISDPSVQAVACIRGGWGCARILPLIDWKAVRQARKPIVGFSDVTSLLLGAWGHAGLVTYHGMWAPRVDDPFTLEAWKAALMSAESFDLFGVQGSGKQIQTLVPSAQSHTGPLLGGNLTVLNQIIGTDYMPRLANSILFLEDLNEPPYRLDRMLTQLHMAKCLDGVKAIILGQFVKCDDAELKISGNATLAEFFRQLGCPTVANAPIGHIRHQLIVPVGASATLSVNETPSLKVTRT